MREIIDKSEWPLEIDSPDLQVMDKVTQNSRGNPVYYHGQVNTKTGKWMGIGRYMISTNETVMGRFVSGRATGYCHGYYPNNEKHYRGFMINNKANGFGRSEYKDGTVKHGEWIEDRFIEGRIF